MRGKFRILATVFAALAIAISGIAALGPSAASAAPAAYHQAATASSVYDPPSESCTATNEGDTVSITYPDGTTIEWECFCEWLKNSQGQKVHVCAWIPTDPNKNGEQQYWTDVNSGLEIDVAGPSTSNGAVVHQWSFTGAANQVWTASQVTDTTYRIVNAYSGKCMGVSASGTNDGAQVVQWDCNGSTDQDWIFQKTFTSIGGWPVYQIVNVNAHKCLGITGGSLNVGANAVIWSCDGSQNQLFY